MSQHFDFFKLSIPQAQELAKQINWERVFDEYHVLEPNIGILASQTAAPKRPSIHTDLPEKLRIILDLPFLREPKFKETCNSALNQVCGLTTYLKTEDAVSLAQGLIQCGADVNVKSKSTGRSCLQEAINGNPKLVQLLLEAGAAIEEADIFSCKQEETVKLLLTSGASWKAVEPSELFWKLCYSEIPVLKVLTVSMSKDGFAIESARDSGESMLHVAAGHRDEAVLAYLIPFFSDIDVPNDCGETALMKACLRLGDDAEPVLRMLLKNRASVHASDAVGKTALMWAIESTDNKSIIDALLKCKPNLGARDSIGNTALHYCAARREFPYLTHVLAQMLLDEGADVNATNSFGQTALMLLSREAPKAATLLVQSGADIEVKDDSGLDVHGYAGSEFRKWLTSHLSKKVNARVKPSHAGPEKVKVRRSPKILQQLEKSTALREEVIAKLENWLPPEHPTEYPDDIWANILLAANLGSEAIRVEVEEIVAEDVDRMGSMLAGPFFVSKQYPMVKGGYPVVQLDLRLASAISGRALGDGLLQLWERAEFGELHIRVIPRDAVSAALLTPFKTDKLRDQADTAVGLDWNSDPARGVVQVFKSYVSCGFQSEQMEDSLDEALSLSDLAKPPTSLLKLIQRFHASVAQAERGAREIQLFGSFQFIQYTHTTIGKHLLFTIPYGASGSAEVFFDVGANGQVAFSSESTTR